MHAGISNDYVSGGATASKDKAATLPSSTQVPVAEDKLDSGNGSECSHRNAHVTKSHDTPELLEMECLLTAGGISLYAYEHSWTEEANTLFVPVIRVSFIQPSFSCTRPADFNTIQISCFDVSFWKCKSGSRNAGRCQRLFYLKNAFQPSCFTFLLLRS